MARYVIVRVKDGWLADQLPTLLAPEGVSVTRLDGNSFDIRCRFESMRFDELPDGGVRAFVVDLVRRLAAVLQIYLPALDTSMSVYDIRKTGPEDVRISPPVRISINDGRPFEDLKAKLPDGSSLLARTLRLSENRERVEKALSLLYAGVPEWGDLYHVVEFLMEEGLAARDSLERKEVERHKQTANHYRHQGLQSPPKLPESPPTLEQSRALLLGLLRRWLEGLPD